VSDGVPVHGDGGRSWLPIGAGLALLAVVGLLVASRGWRTPPAASA
jgi:hypothetical protein